MSDLSLSDLSLEELSRRIRDREITPAEVVEGCLARIEEREDSVRAWAYLASGEALARANSLTEELAPGQPRGALHGIPFGVKDIFDTAGMPTEWGTAVHRGRVPSSDAKIVADLASMGAIVLGKTHTTAYAYFDPAPTRKSAQSGAHSRRVVKRFRRGGGGWHGSFRPG